VLGDVPLPHLQGPMLHQEGAAVPVAQQRAVGEGANAGAAAQEGSDHGGSACKGRRRLPGSEEGEGQNVDLNQQ